jgi:hypothetical protein
MCFTKPKTPKPGAQPAPPAAEGAASLILGPTSNEDDELRNSGVLGRLALRVGRAFGVTGPAAPGGVGTGSVGSGSGGTAGGGGTTGGSTGGSTGTGGSSTGGSSTGGSGTGYGAGGGLRVAGGSGSNAR